MKRQNDAQRQAARKLLQSHMSDELFNQVCELLAYMLLDRAGDKVDDVAQLQNSMRSC